MAEIRLHNLAHSYSGVPKAPEDYAIREMNHVWQQGGAYALLGPSGCGKSTLLNIISGLLSPSQGEVQFDGKAVNRLSPQERNIAQVFQFPVVYDTMTVFDNLAFPLRNQGMDEARVMCWSCTRCCTRKRATSPPTRSRRSPWAVAWCVTTSRRSSSTSR